MFRSVVVPRATRRTLRLGPLLGEALLRLWLRLGEWRPRNRHNILGALGPLLLVLELVIWVGLLILGYALTLHAVGGLRPTTGFGDALYATASAFFTTGLSGQEAVVPLARLLIVLAGFSGLAVVTLVVTFLLSVQGALQRREALVLRLRERTGPNPSGVAILLRHSRLGREHDQALLEFFREWDAWAADVLLSHRAFPILVFFRSTDDDCEWLTALAAVLDAASIIVATRHEGEAEHAALCHRMGSRLARDVARQLRLRPIDTMIERPHFAAAMDRLQRSGFENDDAETWRRFQDLRAAYAPALLTLGTHFGIRQAAW